MTGSRARILGSSSLSTGSTQSRPGRSTPPPSDPFLPLKQILDDIDKCIASELYHPALSVALTLPDICVALTFQKSEHVRRKHYVEFVDKYSKPQELGCDGEYCYKIRGGVIHRGNAVGHSLNEDTHLIMTTPKTSHKMNALTIKSNEHSRQATVFDLESFCGTMKEAVVLWIDQNKSNAVVLQNLPHMMGLRNEILPFVRGTVLVSGPP